MKNVEDLYPLSPMQRTMILHALAAGADTLFNQFRYEVSGPVDGPRLRQAWQRVLDRHPALRTVFVWEGVPDPLQAVRRQVEMPFDELDWSERSEADRNDALTALCARDREAGFEFGRAPLMRVTLIRLGPTRSWMLWSSHHLILDRWCVPLVLGDVLRAYGQPDAPLPAASRFRDYIAWVQNQDRTATQASWQAQLAGLAHASRDHGVDRREGTPSGDPLVASRTLDRETTDAVRAFAKALRITPSILAQAAWALHLSRRAGNSDVVFGATVSGRPPELPGVEGTVGSFINNLPIRARLQPQQTVAEWLNALHEQQSQRSRFEYEALSTLHGWSGLPASEPLFRSLFVWLAPASAATPGSLQLEGVESGGAESAFPVTVSVADGARWELTVRAEKSGLDVSAAVTQWQASLADLIDDPGRTLASWVEHPPVQVTQAPPAARGEFELVDTEDPAAPGRERDELEMVQSVLLAEFRELLSASEMGPEDNFFEFGGSSLLATQLHGRIEKALGRSVPQLPLFQDPTVAGMARFLTGQSWPLRSEIVRTLHPDGDGTPLFCVSSPEVNSIGYVLLTRYLPRSHPTYLVQAPPDSDEVLRMPLAEIETLTQRYVAAIRETQGEGPYRLLGMCGGAILALEIAKSLRASGAEVEFVGVLNTYGLYTLSRRFYVRRAEIRLRYYADRLKAFGGLGFQRQREEVRRVLSRRLRAAGRVFGRSNGAAHPANGVSQNGNGTVHESVDAAQRAASSGLPTGHDEDAIRREWHRLDWPRHLPATPKYDGTVTVFRIRRQPYFRIRDEALGWGKHAQQVAIERLEIGDHLDILREPMVQQTAHAVAAALARLEQETTQ